MVQRIAIPAFFEIGSVYNGKDNWSAVVQAATDVSLVVADDYLIWNSNQKKYLQPGNPAVQSAKAQFVKCRDAGQMVLGYVITYTATRPQTGGTPESPAVFDDINHWYTLYGTDDNGHPLLSGIFFDVGPTLRNLPSQPPSETDQQTYYTGLISNFQDHHPGQNNVLLNAAGFPNEWVVNHPALHKSNIYVIVWEDKITLYNNDNTFQGELPGGKITTETPCWWIDSKYADRLVHVIVNCKEINKTVDCMTEPDMVTAVQKSKKRNAGHVYVYDGNTGCSPTDEQGNKQTCPDPRDSNGRHQNGGYWRLPTFWDDLVKEVKKSSPLTAKGL